jgi:hypothetical protein
MTRRLAVLLCFAAGLRAQMPAPVPLRDAVADKNFYLLTQFESDTAARPLLAKDPQLSRLAKPQAASLWTDVEVDAVAARLSELAPQLAPVAARLRASGFYRRHAGGSDAELLAGAWRDAARGLNNVLAVYAEGKPPRYPPIDSANYDPKSAAYARLLDFASMVVEDSLPGDAPFFTRSLRYALQLLRLNNRDEAGRHEPLEAGENRAAYQAIASIHWGDYPYTAIVVLGAGGDRPNVRLSPGGYLRTALAARRWKDRKAPLILVSGGYVHPNQTPFAEALEMKRALIDEFGIPAAAIIVDPHARHTTTNLRNASRLLYRYGVPVDRAALVTTDPWHSESVGSPAFSDRCRRELGYLPVTIGKRVSKFDLEFLPLLDSLQMDPLDPLDP